MDKFHKGMTSAQHKVISDKSLDTIRQICEVTACHKAMAIYVTVRYIVHLCTSL